MHIKKLKPSEKKELRFKFEFKFEFKFHPDIYHIFDVDENK